MSRDWKLPREGGCRCGALRFEVSGPPMMTAACHCRGCQRMSGSAFSLTLMVPTDAFTVIKGEPVIGGLKGDNKHYFCPSCMSWVFTRPMLLASVVNIRSTMLDETDDVAPFMETCTGEKLGFIDLPVHRSYEVFPDAQEIGPLIEAFSQWDGRPAC